MNVTLEHIRFILFSFFVATLMAVFVHFIKPASTDGLGLPPAQPSVAVGQGGTQ